MNDDALVLSQRVGMFRRVRVTVNGARDLTVSDNGLFRSTEVHFGLGQIAPAPVHVRVLSVPWSVITAILFMLFVAAMLAGWATQDAGAKFGVLFLFGLFLACALNAWKLSRDDFLYKHCESGAFLFGISSRKPSRVEVDSFVDELKKRIEAFRTPQGLTAEESNALYQRHLQYLLSNGVLLPEEHDVILRRLTERVSRKNVIGLVKQ
jgi:hypothetical protein